MNDEAALDRALVLNGGLEDHFKLIWPQVQVVPYVGSWFIGCIAEHLEAFLEGQIRDLVINQPPGTGKSLMTGVGFPTYAWLKHPELAFIYASFDGTLTLREARRSAELAASEWWKERFADKYVVDLNQAMGEYYNSRGGYRFATSVGGKGTGRHGDILVVDDPTKPLETTKEMLEKAEGWYKGTLSSRVKNPKTLRRLIVMQRLHESDLSAFAEKEGFEVLRLPMRYEANACSYTKIGGDLRTTDGELLWPEMYGEEEVKAAEKRLGVWAPAQLQQRPVPAGGAVYKRDWMQKRYKILPNGPKIWIQSWDCAFKGEESSDRVCGLAMCKIGADYYITDRVCDRMTFTATLNAIRTFTKKHKHIIRKLVEDKANGTAAINTLEKEISGLISVDPQGGKYSRANAVAGLWEAGNVYLPEDADWVEEFIAEMCAFPRGANDDQVDAQSQGLNYLFTQKIDQAGAVKGMQTLAQSQQGEGLYQPNKMVWNVMK